MIRARFVDAHDPDRLLLTAAVTINDFCSKIDSVTVHLPCRIDDFGDLHSFALQAQPPVDFTQAPLAVNVISILRPVAISRGPGYGLNCLGALEFLQPRKFISQPLQTLWRNVILCPSRQRGDLVVKILVCFGFFGKSFAHSADQLMWGATGNKPSPL